MQPLPCDFVDTITTTFPAGERWLAELPALLGRYADRWSLTIGEPFPLSFNYVTAATATATANGADGRSLVLKLGVPRAELRREIAALQLYAGRGSCRLLAADQAAGVLLLERLQPGATLATIPDPDKAALIGGQVMADLFRPLPAQSRFRHVEEWAQGFSRLRQRYNGGSGPLPVHLVDTAEALFAELFADAAPDVLLHGDLHHHNILSAANGIDDRWLAIDPKGMVGEPAFETGTFIRNHYNIYGGRVEPQPLLGRCIAILSERLAVDPQRVHNYAIAQAVLSAWWSVEDGGESPAALAAADKACQLADLLLAM